MDIYELQFLGSSKQRETKVRDTVHQLTVSLEKLYNGCTKKLKISRDVLCTKCNGLGGAKDSVTKCTNCSGCGYEVFNQPIGPNLMQRIKRKCTACNGDGEINKDPCKACRGRKKVIFLTCKGCVEMEWEYLK